MSPGRRDPEYPGLKVIFPPPIPSDVSLVLTEQKEHDTYVETYTQSYYIRLYMHVSDMLDLVKKVEHTTNLHVQLNARNVMELQFHTVH